ncbi:hypothetical protein EZI54_00730 [Marinobacter halodurans]|uniref:Host attachment protein n=1 Tax=Marinobacter halodurans TaxID=2528979 RepID=A0ABY1ZUN1_9GAMM|nr:hypothetical protein [Marinobacter halodurans]TBW59512.1 hypothetical protein EZI54_00730 [Marinobacter halodurans]
MSVHAGVWLDHRKAIVIRLTDSHPRVTIVESQARRPSKSSGGQRQKEPFGHQDVVAEDHRDRRYQQALNRYFEDISNHLAGAEALLLFGPGEAKKNYHHFLQDHPQYPFTVRDVQAASAMSPSEASTHVQHYFHKVPH